ncbi:hypothetical protein Rumeso_01982 [Rubellimicrobium mesophilum DSM 19309]|uniref:Uncharacterized protein n=1 Tax=Rubellimicrobium mesophilum DSM 19309 TaxID=442562 RepID=A0A017HRN3_9RHOB|nr:hypothetical protein Rumeso_01982 [Rubellimicrobium mesophilum DSM 19309]
MRCGKAATRPGPENASRPGSPAPLDRRVGRRRVSDFGRYREPGLPP